MNKNRVYKVELTETQLKLIARALEMHSRMRCGQIEESFLPPISERVFEIIKNDKDGYREKRKTVSDCLKTIKLTLWPDLSDNSSHGIGYDKEADLGYEMYKEIHHQFELEEQERCAIENEKYNWNVHSYKPCLNLTEEPNIIIEKKGKIDN